MIGTTIGAYRVIGKLGEGGMGEVYRARDTRLKRDVALKVLPDHFMDDAERRARFEREAQLLAALNHPYIASIYGFEDGALIMEFVDGPTLADRIKRGALPLDEALPIASQIAEALEAAHAQGIVHRDLKPANIKLRPDGTVKVLDFGLAKTLEPIGPDYDPAQSPTVTAATRAGVILGTAAYMSPEQARGKAVDKRADLWAFGCVLYEMLTGRAAFARETVTDTVAAVVTSAPDWSKLPPSTPPSVMRVLRRTLEKDPRRRLRDSADARLDLEEAVAEPPAVDDRTSRRWLTTGVVMGVAIGAAVAGLTTAMVMRQRSTVEGPEFSRIVRLTNGPDKEIAPVISPDGKWVAYISNAGGAANVWVKFLAGGEPANLTAATNLEIASGTGISGLEISPDGTRLAVMARAKGSSAPFSTWALPAPLPGVPRKLLSDNLLGMRWSPDGRQVVFISAGAASGDGLYLADADGSNRRELIAPHGGMHIHWPAWSADGHVYFQRVFTTVVNLDQTEIYRIDAAGTRPMEPFIETPRRAQHPVPLAPGKGMIFSANPRTAEMGLWWRSGDGRVTRQLTTGIGEYAEPRASADGTAIVSTLYEMRQALTRIAVNPAAPVESAVTDAYDGDLDPMIAPSGDRLVFSSSRDGNRHLWTARLDGSDARPVTSGSSEDDRPAYSPDGRQLAFGSDRGGARGIWVVDADGGSLRKVADVTLSGALTWSHDGRYIIYGAAAGAGPGLWRIPITGGTPERIPTPFFASEPASSPTNGVIAYISVKRVKAVSHSNVGFVDLNGRVLYPNLPERPGNGFANGVLCWSPDGRRVAVAQQPANTATIIWLVDPEAAEPYTKLIEFPFGPRVRGMTWTPDGSALIVGKHDWTSDIVLLDQAK